MTTQKSPPYSTHRSMMGFWYVVNIAGGYEAGPFEILEQAEECAAEMNREAQW